MKILIEFDLPDEVLQKSARIATNALFQAPEYGSQARIGYQLIEDAAKKAIAQIDFDPILKTEVARQIPDAVKDVTRNSLRAMVRAQIKAIKESGDLLQSQPEDF